MKVKRFFSKSMQEALKMVREDLGADAVILSNTKMDDGIEIVAALDYEEEPAPEAMPSRVTGSGDSKQPSPSQVARMHAEKHLQLQREMERAKRRIENIRSGREKRDAQSRVSSESSVSEARSDAARASSETGQSWDELSDMKAEIRELKGMLTGQNGRSQGPDGAERGQSLVQKQVSDMLDSLCIARDIRQPLLDGVRDADSYDSAWQSVRNQLKLAISPEPGDVMDQGGIMALVGPTGSGKTMTIGKMAARYVMKFGAENIALVTTDRYRIAAHEQLKVFGRILNVPVHVVDEEHCLDDILDRLTEKKLVLIDTAGLMHADRCWSEQLQELRMSHHRIQSYLVMSAVGQYQVMCSNYHYYKIAGLAGTIITKVDEAVSLGEIISYLVATHTRAVYMTDGQRVPEDLHLVDSPQLLDKAEALLNCSERWVTIRSNEEDGLSNSLYFHSA